MRPRNTTAITRRSIVRLAVDNVDASWRRSVPLLAVAAGAMFAGLIAGPGTLADHQRTEWERQDAGANVVVAKSERGLSSPACESLGTSSGVAAAGSLREVDVRPVRPGVNAPTGDVTAGMRRLLVGRTDGGGPLVGSSLATTLLLTTEGSASTVIEPRGVRTENFTSWQLWSAPVHGLADQCWVELTDDGFASGIDLVTAALLPTSPDLEVATLMFDAGPHPFDATMTIVAPLASGLLVGLAGLMYARFRRIDLAMYRLLGFPADRARKVLGWELGLLGMAAFAVATGGMLLVLSGDPITRQVVMLGVAHLVLAALTSAAVVQLGLRALGRSTTQLAVLREGA